MQRRRDQVARNFRLGQLFENVVAGSASNNQNVAVFEQVHIYPFSDNACNVARKHNGEKLYVKLDMIRAKRLPDGSFHVLDYTDMKSSPTAPLTKGQKKGYPLLEKFGGKVKCDRWSRNLISGRYVSFLQDVVGGVGDVLPLHSINIIRPRKKSSRDQAGQRNPGVPTKYLACGRSRGSETWSSEESAWIFQAVFQDLA